jgi:hypothetical protein
VEVGAMTAIAFSSRVGGAEMEAARGGLRHRALLVGGAFQVVFGALWTLRGLAVVAPLSVAAACSAAVLGAGLTAVYRLRSNCPRPTGPAARHLEHRLTVATAVQLVASAVLPVLVAMVSSRLVLPSIVFTIGVLLLYVHRVAGTPYQGTSGWLLIALSIVVLGFGGPAQTASVCIASAVTLLSCAGAGFRWLGREGSKPNA